MKDASKDLIRFYTVIGVNIENICDIAELANARFLWELKLSRLSPFGMVFKNNLLIKERESFELCFISVGIQ
jgi:hypothetical protein